jgi:hypothetical protein
MEKAMSEATQHMVDYVMIKAVDFNGSDFDGTPFSEAPTWLRHSLANGRITPVAADRDYALWDVETERGVVRAEPDDRIEWRSGSNTLRVMRRGEWYEVKPEEEPEADGADGKRT